MSKRLKHVIEEVDSFKKTPTLCYLPFVHVEADARGRFEHCCMSENPIEDENGVWYDAQTGGTISEAFNSKFMHDLRQDFLDGKRPSICKKCWDEEDAGLESKRITWAHYFSHDFPELNNIFRNDVTEKDIVYLDLKLGNICNLKCRICGPWSSSKWAQEEIETNIKFHGLQKENIKKTRSYKILKQGEWPRKSPNFWKDLEELLPNIKHIDFTGGEPWMIKEQFEVLEKLIEKGYSKNIYIHYNTNGTQLPKHAIHNIFPHFKSVKASFSIDDVGDRFEYQRYGAKWDEVNENIRYICNNKINLQTEICTTVNMFNLHNLPDLIDWITSIENLKSWYLNLMHYPTHLNIAVHTKEVKDEIARKLRQIDWSSIENKNIQKDPGTNYVNISFKDQIEPIIEYMYNYDIYSEHGLKKNEDIKTYLHSSIYKVDSMREKNLNQVDATLSKYIDYDYEYLSTVYKANEN